MLDLKSQLAAAGIVTAEQVKAFDEREAKAKQAREEKARKQKEPRKNHGGRGKGPNPGSAKGQKRSPGNKKGGNGGSFVEELKAMGRGEAYDRIRKIVAHSRLDDKERTIPLPDDQTFNFVTATGSIGRLYLNAETVASLKNGKSAISSFMSNHGLSHCVLPKDIALDLAQVFPLWLRHLRGHEPIVEVPKEPDASEATATVQPSAASEQDRSNEAVAPEPNATSAALSPEDAG